MADTSKRAADTEGKELPAPVAARRGGPVQFFEEVRRETSKVTWPTWKETYLTTIVVFAMVGLTMTFFFAVDWLLAMGERWLIGAMS
ncbi:MAG TPA: preprotein translocase subunit SecE [Rhizomicrobium sp.]|nr:preprotein translocase subunit SecE [Rhizomicrobium sp.]